MSPAASASTAYCSTPSRSGPHCPRRIGSVLYNTINAYPTELRDGRYSYLNLVNDLIHPWHSGYYADSVQ